MRNFPTLHHQHFKKIDSTHTYAKSHYNKLHPGQWMLYSAAQQTAGIGSNSRNWHSPADVNIYATYSFLIPEKQADKLSLIPQTICLQVSKLLEMHNINSTIKWVNDVLVDQKKICGILAESASKIFIDDNGLSYTAVLVSIGLNVNANQADLAKIPQLATSMFEVTSKKYDLASLLNNLNSLVIQGITILFEHGFANLRKQITQKFEYFEHKPISFKQTNGLITTGVITGIGTMGELILQTGPDKFENFYNGQIIR